MFTTPLHIHNAVEHLREAYLKINNEKFNYHCMDKSSQDKYHELVALCECVVNKHGSKTND